MQKRVNLVDLVKSFQTSVYLQHSAAIQPIYPVSAPRTENEPCQVCRIPLRTSRPAQVSELRGLFRRSDAAYQIRVAQYNILAGYLGNNMEPWFLYGVDMPPERREAISKLHAERGPDGAYKNVGWPNYVRGVLSAEEQAAVERVQFGQVHPRLLHRSIGQT